MTSMRVGEWHDFEVGNVLQLPQSEPELVLISGNGVRYLIPFLPYQHYGLNKGKTIRCRVDKINCSGKIFLEPENPWYTEGKSFQFRFLRKIEGFNILGQLEYVWVLADNSDKEISMIIEPKFFTLDPGSSIECIVKKIKKGKLLLGHPYSLKPPDPDRLGCWNHLEIVEDDVLKSNERYYALKDVSGEKFLLKAKYYAKYNLKHGQIILCKYVKWKPENGWVIEPLHPLYREGELFKFRVDHIDPHNSEDEFIIFYITDFSGNRIAVEAPLSQKEHLKPAQDIMLFIREVRKGKPVLLWADATES
ncbi:MAG: hypothetical protein AB9842_08550 [Bacteroidales bacterium]